MNKKEKEELRKGKIPFEAICERREELWQDLNADLIKEGDEFVKELDILTEIMKTVTDKKSGWYLYEGGLIYLIKSYQTSYGYDWDVCIEYIPIKNLKSLEKDFTAENYEVEQVTIQHENWFKELKKVDVEIKIKK